MSSYSDPPSSPLDGNTIELRPETPALEHLLDYATQNALLRCNVFMPARIVAINSDQNVDVQPLPKTLYATDTDSTVKPVLPDVHVAMSVGAVWSVRTPLAVGDLGYLLFADRNAEAYYESDGSAPYSPADTRLHDLADAVFVPGLPTKTQKTNYGKSDTDMVLHNGSAVMRLQKGGSFVLTNGQQELLDLLDQLLQVLTTQFFTPTLMGPQPPLATTVSAITQIKTKLATLKGTT